MQTLQQQKTSKEKLQKTNNFTVELYIRFVYKSLKLFYFHMSVKCNPPILAPEITLMT